MTATRCGKAIADEWIHANMAREYAKDTDLSPRGILTDWRVFFQKLGRSLWLNEPSLFDRLQIAVSVSVTLRWLKVCGAVVQMSQPDDRASKRQAVDRIRVGMPEVLSIKLRRDGTLLASTDVSGYREP